MDQRLKITTYLQRWVSSLALGLLSLDSLSLSIYLSISISISLLKKTMTIWYVLFLCAFDTILIHLSICPPTQITVICRYLPSLAIKKQLRNVYKTMYPPTIQFTNFIQGHS